MKGGFEESAGIAGNSSDAGGFECKICYELAEEPIVTLCGHLYCWPCIYRWLHSHSQSHECPVCKTRVEENMLVPIYGTGKSSLNKKRRMSVSGDKISHLPTGQRPETETAPPTRVSNPTPARPPAPADSIKTIRGMFARLELKEELNQELNLKRVLKEELEELREKLKEELEELKEELNRELEELKRDHDQRLLGSYPAGAI